MVADRHRLAGYHNKHCWRAFLGYQHRWHWTTWTPKIRVLSDFFCYFRLRRTITVNFRWNILEIDQDNLRTKLNWCCGASHELINYSIITTLPIATSADPLFTRGLQQLAEHAMHNHWRTAVYDSQTTLLSIELYLLSDFKRVNTCRFDFEQTYSRL